MLAGAALAGCDGGAVDTEAAHRDDAALVAPPVSLSAVQSSYTSCGGLATSWLTFEVINDSAIDLTLTSFHVDAPSASGTFAFASGTTIAAGDALRFECKGALGGREVDMFEEVSSVILTYDDGTNAFDKIDENLHSTSQSFDFCDTAFSTDSFDYRVVTPAL